MRVEECHEFVAGVRYVQRENVILFEARKGP